MDDKRLAGSTDWNPTAKLHFKLNPRITEQWCSQTPFLEVDRRLGSLNKLFIFATIIFGPVVQWIE